jgi:hypothetical protein
MSRLASGRLTALLKFDVEQLKEAVTAPPQSNAGPVADWRKPSLGRQMRPRRLQRVRGMIAKVKHLVRVIAQGTELDCFVRAVRDEYQELITTRIGRGEVLWAQFEAAVEACRANPKGDDRQITEKVNEMARGQHWGIRNAP